MDKTKTKAKEGWLRETMPKVADMVDERRRDWGDEHVRSCITAGMKGLPNQFYAFESGHIVGTPFDGRADLEELAKLGAMLVGSAFMVMRPPEGAQ